VIPKPPDVEPEGCKLQQEFLLPLPDFEQKGCKLQKVLPPLYLKAELIDIMDAQL
jgi:hypothetical protein